MDFAEKDFFPTLRWGCINIYLFPIYTRYLGRNIFSSDGNEFLFPREKTFLFPLGEKEAVRKAFQCVAHKRRRNMKKKIPQDRRRRENLGKVALLDFELLDELGRGGGLDSTFR